MGFLYEMKAILKSRTSILCMILLLVLQMITYLQLDTSSLHPTSEAKIAEIEKRIYSDKGWLATVENDYLLHKKQLSLEEQASYENYIIFQKWRIDHLHEIKQMATIDIDVARKWEIYHSIVLLDLFADPQKGDDYGYQIFVDTIQQFQLPIIELPFDQEKLVDIQLRYTSGEEERHVQYTSFKQDIKHQIATYIEQSDNVVMQSYLATQFSSTSLFAQVFWPLCLCYALVYQLRVRKQRSIQLWECQPRNRGLLLYQQCLALFASFWFIYLASFLIPLLMIFMRYGIGSFHYPIFTDTSGLYELQTFAHDPTMIGHIGLSSFVSVPTTGFYNAYAMLSEQVELIPVYQPLLLGLIMDVMRSIVAILIATCCAQLTRKLMLQVVIALSCFGLILVYQRIEIRLVYLHPLSITSGFTMVQGGQGASWFAAMLALTIWSVVLMGIAWKGYQKVDLS